MQTYCWKWFNSSNKNSFACNGINSADCGLFCASSGVICAKIALDIINTAYKLYEGKIPPNLTAFTSQYSITALVLILKSGSDGLHGLDSIALNLLSTGVQIMYSMSKSQYVKNESKW